MRRMDLTGLKFNRWTVLRPSKTRLKKSFWTCRCECGNVKDVNAFELRGGGSKSCGCLRSETSPKNSKRLHGMTKTPEWKAWSSMRERCFNLKHEHYRNYGGRGIKICKRWDKFENFFDDMGRKPNKNYSLDRINNDGNYCKSNCRWATWKQQANNRRPYGSANVRK